MFCQQHVLILANHIRRSDIVIFLFRVWKWMSREVRIVGIGGKIRKKEVHIHFDYEYRSCMDPHKLKTHTHIKQDKLTTVLDCLFL